MKRSFLLYISALAATFVLSCSPQKVVLDPATVNAIAPSANVYRGSYGKPLDILHTKLELKLDWDSLLVIGKATIEAKPYFYPISEFTLDAKGFRINQVSLIKGDQKVPLRYTYNRKKLSVDLDKVYRADQKFALYIDYVANPSALKVGSDISSPDNRGFYFINPRGEDPAIPKQFWTQGEAENNSAWFPTIDGPQEKMTQELSITVPKSFVTLSNGYLDFSSDNGDGTRTDTWRQEQPHSTYLTMVAGGNFKVIKDHWEDKEVSYYMEPEFAGNAKLIFGKTPEMIGFFSKLLGVDFPWEKYSQIVVRNFSSGAMENTTATVFFEGMNMSAAQHQDENYEEIISHELFHHWFGDLVTAESWANLPLNESFATYGEYLWNEHKYGRDLADLYLNKDLEVYLNDEQAKQRQVIRFNYGDPDQMFDAVSYQKGGRILHMLRKTVGDDAFFKGLNLYLRQNSFKTAEIHNLRLAFEEVTGQDLNWFFNQWFLSSGHPVLDIQTGYDAISKKVNITVGQLQDVGKIAAYRLPLSVDIYVNGKVERKELVVSRRQQSFSFDLPESPQLINVDADKYLLAEKREKKTVEQNAFQYRNAPLFMDRFESLSALSKLTSEKTAREVILEALADKNWSLRLMAVNTIPALGLTTEEKNVVYPQLVKLATEDPRSYVRAAAIVLIAKTFADKDNQELWSKVQSDQAPSVVKAFKSVR